MNARDRRKAEEIANYARAIQSKLTRVIKYAEEGHLRAYHLLWLESLVCLERRLEEALSKLVDEPSSPSRRTDRPHAERTP